MALGVLLSAVMQTIAIHELAAVAGGVTVMTTENVRKDQANDAATVGATTRGRDLCERFARDDQFKQCIIDAAKPFDIYPRHPVEVK